MSELNGHGRTQRRQRGKPLRGGGHQENVELEQAVSSDLPAASTEPDDASVAFDFRGVQLRTIKRLGQTWFVAADICAALDIANPRDALARLRENEKGVGVTDTPGGRQEVNIVNESGVYGLAFRSRKQETEDFRYWVTNEVIPSIRKTGRYEAGAPVIAGAFDWLNVPGRYMTLVKSATDRTTYELPIESMIGEVTGTDVHILAHQIKLIELTWLQMRQFDAVGLTAEDDLHLQRLSAVIKSAGELAARYLNYPIP